MNENLHIIVLNWNGTQDTIECLKSLKENSCTEYTTVLVDNGSEEQNLQELKTWCNENYSLVVYYNRQEAENGGLPELEDELNKTLSSNKLVFVENTENLGFAAGNNVALRYALRVNATYAMLLNNDTVVEKDSIAVLVDFLNVNKDYVAVTPQIRYYDPSDRIWNCGGKVMWFGNRKYYFAGEHISKVPQKGFRDITFITGCALLFKPQTTDILTEKFFFGEEDLDFSFRQKIAHNKMACCFSSVIYHKVNASANKHSLNTIGDIYLQYLSRLLNNKQYASTIKFTIIFIITFCYAIPMVRIRYGYNIKKIIRMFIRIITDLRVVKSIDQDGFKRCLNEDFTRPVKWIPNSSQ